MVARSTSFVSRNARHDTTQYCNSLTCVLLRIVLYRLASFHSSLFRVCPRSASFLRRAKKQGNLNQTFGVNVYDSNFWLLLIWKPPVFWKFLFNRYYLFTFRLARECSVPRARVQRYLAFYTLPLSWSSFLSSLDLIIHPRIQDFAACHRRRRE